MKNSKISPLKAVEMYHQRYLEYEKAFNDNPFDENKRQQELLKLAESDIDVESDEFLDKMLDLVVEKPQKLADVNNAAFRFILYAEFFMLTQEEELPDNILKDYENLPIKNKMKSYFSIENGKFVRKEKTELTEEDKVFFKNLIKKVN